MPDPFHKVRPGDDLNVSATAYNAIIDAAQAEQRRQLGNDSDPRTTTRDASIIRVKNGTGSDLPRLSVVGLSTPIFTPTDSLDAFLREVTFRGIVPTSSHLGKFAILLEPAATDQVVRAFVSGVCPVMVDVSDADHTCADVDPTQTDALASSETGTAQILWKEGDDDPVYATGPQWAVVRFGPSCGVQEPYPYEPY